MGAGQVHCINGKTGRGAVERHKGRIEAVQCPVNIEEDEIRTLMEVDRVVQSCRTMRCCCSGYEAMEWLLERGEEAATECCRE